MQRLKRISKMRNSARRIEFSGMGYYLVCSEERSSLRKKLTKNGRHFVMGLISVEQGFKIKYNYCISTGSASTVKLVPFDFERNVLVLIPNETSWFN